MSNYSITANTLDEMMVIWTVHSLPRGLRSRNSVGFAEEFCIKVVEAFDLPDHLIDEAVALFQRRIHNLGIAG